MTETVSLRAFYENKTNMPRTVRAIASKSMAHRLLLAAALTAWQKGEQNWQNLVKLRTTSADIEATRACLISMEEALRDKNKEGKLLRCGESGSTLRFLLPVAGALGIDCAFLPEGRLSQRPLSPLYEELLAHGCQMSPQGTVPFAISGQLHGGTFTIPGNISSQYITGLLFALPLLKEDSHIVVTGTWESVDYIKMTLQVLELSGIKYQITEDGFFIAGGQTYALSEMKTVEGDWSNAATWLCLGALCRDGITCDNLLFDSAQGDRRVLDVLRSFGAEVIRDAGQNSVLVRCAESGLHATVIDAGNIPDLIPVLSVVAAVASGTTQIIHAERLKLKESDRLQAITETLTSLGVRVKNTGEGLLIEGGASLHCATLDSFNDHRIVMMASIASALIAEGAVTIRRAEAINKSFPTFFEECNALGATCCCTDREEE